MSPTAREVPIRRSVIHLGQRSIALRAGEFAVHSFRDLAHGETAMAIVCGDLAGPGPVLARVHSACLTSECLMGCDCDCAEQLGGALETMAATGQGVLFYLMQEGRGAGLTAKARDRMFVQASRNRITTFEAYAEMGLPSDLRRYDAIAPIARMVGLRGPICLLTNNPEKAAAVSKVLAEDGVEVGRTQPIQGPPSDFNRDYLSAKHESGHALAPPDRTVGALPPRRVRVMPPVVLPGAPNRILTASYFLPVEVDDVVEWFRLCVLFDCDSARESIVMSHGDTPMAEWVAASARAHEPAETVRMSLFDRLPAVRAEGRWALRRRLREIREAGRGSVHVRLDDRHRAEN